MEISQTAELHPEDVGLFREVEKAAFAVARHFHLPLKIIEPKRRPHPGGTTGVCYLGEGRCGIVFRFRIGEKWYPKPLSKEQVFDTVAHELSHLRYPSHSEMQRKFQKQILELLLVVDYDRQYSLGKLKQMCYYKGLSTSGDKKTLARRLLNG